MTAWDFAVEVKLFSEQLSVVFKPENDTKCIVALGLSFYSSINITSCTVFLLCQLLYIKICIGFTNMHTQMNNLNSSTLKEIMESADINKNC